MKLFCEFRCLPKKEKSKLMCLQERSIYLNSDASKYVCENNKLNRQKKLIIGVEIS